MNDYKMTPGERRATWGLGTVFSLRMLGMFMVLPVLTTYGMALQGAIRHGSARCQRSINRYCHWYLWSDSGRFSDSVWPAFRFRFRLACFQTALVANH